MSFNSDLVIINPRGEAFTRPVILVVIGLVNDPPPSVIDGKGNIKTIICRSNAFRFPIADSERIIVSGLAGRNHVWDKHFEDRNGYCFFVDAELALRHQPDIVYAI